MTWRTRTRHSGTCARAGWRGRRCSCPSVPGMPPTVELLFWEGCPSHPAAIADLRTALAERGLDPEAVVLREIVTDEDARRERFTGSPTIRFDGADVVDPGDEPPALNGRVYRL